MSSTTFSGRAPEKLVSFANALSLKEYGVSFGKYCSTLLLESINSTGHFPELVQTEDASKKEAFERIKNFSNQNQNAEVGSLSDLQIKELIADRYEH